MSKTEMVCLSKDNKVVPCDSPEAAYQMQKQDAQKAGYYDSDSGDEQPGEPLEGAEPVEKKAAKPAENKAVSYPPANKGK